MRGAINVPSSVKSVSVISNYYSELVNIINSSLASSNIGVSRSKDANLHRIHVLSEQFDRRQLSINISGRVNEYELIYTVKFQLKAPGKSEVEDKIILYRDYSFDENNIMGNSDREDYIKKGMMSTASTLIFNKLISSINNQ
jgi:LPS-assembly lipoprotein